MQRSASRSKVTVYRLLFLLLCGALNAEESYWDASLVRAYVHNSELQRRWAMAFMAPHLQSLRGDESILDIGCGDGKISADLSKFVPNGSVLGIDPSPSMLDWALKQYSPSDYPHLRFQSGSFLNPDLKERFDRIVSFCALQHCPDQTEALHQAQLLLKPGGKLLILVPALHNDAWKQARTTIQARPRWAAYWISAKPRIFLSTSQYTHLLESLGFSQIQVKEIATRDPFVDREELLSWLQGTFTPAIPASEARAFYEEWIEEYLRLDPSAQGSNGEVYIKLGYITIEAGL